MQCSALLFLGVPASDFAADFIEVENDIEFSPRRFNNSLNCFVDLPIASDWNSHFTNRCSRQNTCRRSTWRTQINFDPAVRSTCWTSDESEMALLGLGTTGLTLLANQDWLIKTSMNGGISAKVTAESSFKSAST